MSPFVHLYRTPPSKAPAAVRTAPLQLPRALGGATQVATGPIAIGPRTPITLVPVSPVEAVDLAPAFKMITVMLERALRHLTEELAAVEAALRATRDPKKRAELEARAAEVRQQLQPLEAMQKAVKRAEANPATTPADVTRLQDLVLQSTGRLSSGDRLKVQLLVEDLVRNIGRTPVSDRGLFDVSRGLLDVEINLQQRLSALLDERANGVSRPRAAQLAAEIEATTRQLAATRSARAALDRLADNQKATPETLSAAMDYARELMGAAMSNPETAQKLAAALERLAR